jgi:Tfp pilus assembly protein PilE
MKKAFITVALIALLGGCASTGSTETANKSQVKAANATLSAEEMREQEILCTRETRTGSHRKSRVCRTIEQRKREQDAAAEILRNTQTGGGKVVN